MAKQRHLPAEFFFGAEAVKRSAVYLVFLCLLGSLCAHGVAQQPSPSAKPAASAPEEAKTAIDPVAGGRGRASGEH